MANRRFAKSFAQALATRLLPVGMQALRAHHATPERKERRRVVRLAGRRQAIKHFKDMRVINKLNEVNHG